MVGLFTLLMLLPSIFQGGLKDITKPYLGIYECTEARLDEEDLLENYTNVALELKSGGKYVLYYTSKGEKQKKITGKYKYDSEKGTFTMYGDGLMFKRQYTLQEGEIYVFVQIGKKNLVLKFEQK